MRQFRVSTPFAGLLATVMLVGCGGAAADGGEWQGTVTDSAGVEVVTTTGSGLWQAGEGWTIERDLRIGAAAGAPEYQFGQIAGVDVGSDGRIYVYDQQASEVRVFDPDGGFVTRMGEAGGGPGELGQNAGPLIVGPGDTIFVPDVAQQRVTRFAPTGEPAGSFPVSMAEGIPVKWMEAPDGALVQQSMVMALPNQPAVEPRNLLLRREPSGQISDTLMIMPAGETMDFSGGQPKMTIFAPEPMWSIGPDGRIVYGTNAAYRLEIRSPQGEVRRIITRAQERQPITESDQLEFRRVIQEAWQDAGMPPEAVDMMSQAIQFADYYPAFANIFAGPEGTTWVQTIQSPESVNAAGGSFDLQDLGGPEWEVFDDQGRLLGVVEMPDRFIPLVFQEDHIYGVVRDDLDIQYPARMRIARAAGEATGD